MTCLHTQILLSGCFLKAGDFFFLKMYQNSGKSVFGEKFRIESLTCFWNCTFPGAGSCASYFMVCNINGVLESHILC